MPRGFSGCCVTEDKRDGRWYRDLSDVVSEGCIYRDQLRTEFLREF